MKRITILRRISQAVFFGISGTWLAIGALRCPFGVPFVSCQSCPSTDCPGRYLQIPFIGLMALTGAVFGRAFCGWACPFGFISDALGRLPKLQATVSERFAGVDRALKLLKWPALALTVYLVFAVNYTEVRPWAYVVRADSVFNLEAIEVAQALGDPVYVTRAWVALGALLAGLIVSRAWCRYLCPLGAFLGLTNRFSLLRIGKRDESLPDCGLYPRECIQRTTPGTTDCVICGECVEGCPRRNLGLRSRYGHGTADVEAVGGTGPSHRAVG